MDVDLELPSWIKNVLHVPPSKNQASPGGHDPGNWAVVRRSFAGHYATPAPETIVFEVGSEENQGLLTDFLAYMGRRTGIELPPQEKGDLLYPFFSQVIASMESAQAFLDVLRTLGEKFTLDQAIAGWDEADLPEAHMWYEAGEEYALFAARIAKTIDYYHSANLKLLQFRWESNVIVHDQYQYLLFGQTTERIPDREWFVAAWPFVQRFRVNFGMFLTEALVYERVTIVGKPTIATPVTVRDEQFLQQARERSGTGFPLIERLEVESPDALAVELDERINRGRPFGSSDESSEGEA